MHAALITLSILFLIFAPHLALAQQGDELNFPTTEEIQLVATQSERVFQQYKDSLELEDQLPSAKARAGSTTGEHQTVEVAKTLLERLKSNPDLFHGSLGLLLLSTLDDASRNAAICSNLANTDIIVRLAMGKQMDDVQISAMADTVKTCANVSAQIYTVSENVHALMLREMDGLVRQNQVTLKTLEKCADRMNEKKQQ